MNWFKRKHRHIWVYPTVTHRLCCCGAFEREESVPDLKKGRIYYWAKFDGTVEMWEKSVKQSKEDIEASKQYQAVMDKEEEDRKKYAASFCQSNSKDETQGENKK